MKTLIRWVLTWWFRFRAFDAGVLAAKGPVLLVPNHVSWLDWAFLYALLDDDWKFVTSATTAEASWFHRKIMLNRRTFPVDTASPYAVKRMAEFLATGGRLVLFAEGRISLTGSLMRLYDGSGFLVHRTQARVIMCHLRGAVRVPFVRHLGWTRWFPRVTAHFSPAMEPPRFHGLPAAVARRRATAWIRDHMLRQQFEAEMQLGPTHVVAAVAEAAWHRPRKMALEDIRQQPLSYRRLMVGVDVLAWRLEALMGGVTPKGGRVAVLLPNMNATPVALLALMAIGRVPAILNFSSGVPVMRACLVLAGCRQILTSRAFVEKARVPLEALAGGDVSVVYLEDVGGSVPGWLKLVRLMANTLCCGGRWLGATAAPDQSAVVLFTSGSEGVPKGVELTHRNLLANVRQITAHLDVSDEERFFNAMPLFHSFGLTTCTLFPLIRGEYVFLYPSPLHYRVVPALVYDKACTVLVGTNTFLNGYARRAHPYDFNSLRYLVAGAEKLQEATANTWARTFGVRVIEGYGATECSPVICANSRIEPRFGSVGRFLPGMEWRLEPVEGVPEGGRLLVRGANVMKGYINPEANARFQQMGGWYDTGDIVRVDADGFVFILGRLKRFAKVSGEMVSLAAIEEALDGAFPHHGRRCEVAVVAVACDAKGEKLIAIATSRELTMSEVRDAIRAKGLSNLSIPRELRFIPDIPKLGTGKTDHRTLLAWLAAQDAPATGSVP